MPINVPFKNRAEAKQRNDIEKNKPVGEDRSMEEDGDAGGREPSRGILSRICCCSPCCRGKDAGQTGETSPLLGKKGLHFTVLFLPLLSVPFVCVSVCLRSYS